MPKKYKVNYSKDRVNEAMDRLRAAFQHRTTDRIPFVCIDADYAQSFNTGDFSYHKLAHDDEWALRLQIDALNDLFSKCPDTDRIPHLDLTGAGNGIVASMFGVQVVESEFQTPTAKGPIIKDLEKDLPKIPKRINPFTDGVGPRYLKRLKFFLDATGGEIPCQVFDYGSPFHLATMLMDQTQLMMEMYEHPELVKQLLDIGAQAIMDVIEAERRVAGDPRLIIGNPYQPDFHDHTILWDDYVSVLNPNMWLEFCREPNERIFKRFGSGHLHTCGPLLDRPVDAILDVKGADSIDLIAIRGTTRTREDLLKLKQRIKGKLVAIGSLAETSQICPDYARLRQGRKHLDREFLHAMNDQGGLVWVEVCSAEEARHLIELAKLC